MNEANKSLTLSDTGIGMNEEDLISHLGTIARSCTKNFLSQLSGDARKDSNLIGQFGVGFYSVFMVADKVQVISRKAGEEKRYKWISDGTDSFEIEVASGDDARKPAGKVEGLTALAEVKQRMQPEQKALYYITGGSESMLRNSPLLEIYKRKKIEVLILDDDLDGIVFSMVPKYQDMDLKAVNKSSISEDLKDDSTPGKAEELGPLLEKMKAVLGDVVKEVRASSRLADSPSVVVSDEHEPSARMRQMMQAMGQKDLPELKPILEINPDHQIVKKLLADHETGRIEDATWLLFDQAVLLEGVPLKDPVVFVQRLNRVLNRSICSQAEADLRGFANRADHPNVQLCGKSLASTVDHWAHNSLRIGLETGAFCREQYGVGSAKRGLCPETPESCLGDSSFNTLAYHRDGMPGRKQNF